MTFLSGEGSSEKRKSREDELRDVNSVDHKGLLPLLLSALLWGGLGRC